MVVASRVCIIPSVRACTCVRMVILTLLNAVRFSWLAQLVIAPDCVLREVEGLSPGRTNTHGLKITEENLLPF